MQVLNDNKQGVAQGARQNVSGNMPEKKFSIGGVSATVWKNEKVNQEGQPISFKTISFEKNYKDKQGEWKGTNNLRINDLPKAALVLNKAYEYITMSNN